VTIWGINIKKKRKQNTPYYTIMTFKKPQNETPYIDVIWGK
jgi:hypothetical protein